MKKSTEDHRKGYYLKVILIAVICLLGILLRLFLIEQSNWKIDYDEAMIILLARQIGQGDFHAFIPGQPTLGAIEAYLLNALYWLLGDSIFTFRIYSVAINVGYILSAICLGYLLRDWYTAYVAALLAAFAPAYMLVTGLKTWGTTIETIVFGNFLFFSAVKTIEADQKSWAIFSGLLGGILFWGSWLSAYYLIPVALLFICFHKSTFKYLFMVIFSFFVGSLPLWIHNFLHGWESFTTVFEAMSIRGVSRLDTLVDITVNQYPKLITGYEAWFTTNVVLKIVALSFYTAGILALLFLGFRERNKVAILLTLMSLTIPLIYIQSGYGADAFNQFSVDTTGRYLLMIHSALPVGIAALVLYLPEKMTILVTSTLILTNLIGAVFINTSWAFDSPYYNRQPDNMRGIVSYLIEEGYTHVWTDIGIAQPLMVYSGGEIQASDFHDYYVGGIQRFPDIFDEVYASDNAVFLVPIISGQIDSPLARELEKNQIEFEVVYFDSIAIYIPKYRVEPLTIIDGLGLQY